MYFYWNARANLHILGQPNTFLATQVALDAAVSHGRRVQYRALKAAAVRVGAKLDSAKAVQGLSEGEVFTAVEQKQIGGRWRVRMSRGWVSLTAASGRPLCVAEAAVQLFMQSVPVLQQLGEAGRRRRSRFRAPLYI